MSFSSHHMLATLNVFFVCQFSQRLFHIKKMNICLRFSFFVYLFSFCDECWIFISNFSWESIFFIFFVVFVTISLRHYIQFFYTNKNRWKSLLLVIFLLCIDRCCLCLNVGYCFYLGSSQKMKNCIMTVKIYYWGRLRLGFMLELYFCWVWLLFIGGFLIFLCFGSRMIYEE